MSLPSPLRRKGILALVLALALMGVVAAARPQSAFAHPLGNFTINHYSGITISPGELRLLYVIDMAEIPAFQERAGIDLDKDGQVSASESERYLSAKAEELRKGLRLSLNDVPLLLEPAGSRLSFPPGQGGLPTLRIELMFTARAIPASPGPQALHYRDDNYAGRLGWKEIVVQAAEGVVLLQTDALPESRSDELRAYPDDLLSSPPAMLQSRADFTVTGAVPSEAMPADAPATMASDQPRSRDLLASLISTDQLRPTVVALAFVVAVGLGALHALSPGHGKTIMAAYLVGTRGTALHALFLGITVTVSHTLGVIGLGLVVLFASHIIAPEELYPWLGLVSGVVIVVVGLWLLAARLRNAARVAHAHHEQDADHEHGHAHSHSHGDTKLLALSRLFDRATQVGARLAHGHSHDSGAGHTHLHGHAHSHHHKGDDGSHEHQRPHKSAREGGRLRITWKSLTALGIVGGLVPSASALIILLASISLQRIGLGLLLILAFSAGMAAVLGGVGLLLVYAGRFVERFQSRGGHGAGLAGLLPTITALVVLASGLMVVIRAALQLDLL